MTAGTKAQIAMLRKQCVLEQNLNSHNQDFRSLHKAKYENQLRKKRNSAAERTESVWWVEHKPSTTVGNHHTNHRTGSIEKWMAYKIRIICLTFDFVAERKQTAPPHRCRRRFLGTKKVDKMEDGRAWIHRKLSGGQHRKFNRRNFRNRKNLFYICCMIYVHNLLKISRGLQLIQRQKNLNYKRGQ